MSSAVQQVGPCRLVVESVGRRSSAVPCWRRGASAQRTRAAEQSGSGRSRTPRPEPPSSCPERHPSSGIGLWVPESRRTSCDLLILVDESAEAVVSLDLVDLGCCATGEWSCGSGLAQGAVRPVTVVVAFELV